MPLHAARPAATGVVHVQEQHGGVAKSAPRAVQEAATQVTRFSVLGCVNLRLVIKD